MQARLLAASDLACRRGDRLLFAGLTMSLAAGEAIHVVGPNGVGKSSLLRVLAGLLGAWAGTVDRYGAIGVLDERPALDPALPLGQALGFWQRLDGPADNALARLGLADLLDVPVRYLSTGQRKRAAMARLIGQQAPIWLLDEPLNGLDAGAVAIVGQLLAQHCATGGGCVIASHQDLAVAGLGRIDLADYRP